MVIVRAYDVSAWSATAYTIIRAEGWCGAVAPPRSFSTATARTVQNVTNAGMPPGAIESVSPSDNQRRYGTCLLNGG